MNNKILVLGIFCIVFAVLLVVSSVGLFRWYRGIFFALMGTALVVRAVFWPIADDE